MTEVRQTRHPDVSFTFPAVATAARDARRALAPLLREDGLFAGDVQLAASEIVTNVVRHTEHGGRLEAWDDDPLLIEVADSSPLPMRARSARDERGGRGLAILQELASQWGVRASGSGKVVWATFERPVANTAPL